MGAKELIVVTPTEAESIKYVHNVFLAVKVGTFNELYSALAERKTNYQLCADIACEITGWINPRHVDVPGHDGHFGYGGECFPKDIGAFLTKYHHLDLDIIKATINSNTARRKSAKKVISPNRKAYKRIDLERKTAAQKKQQVRRSNVK
jgi:UDPglucose 6-dehydrogenase